MCREAYERRLDYHRICQAPDSEGTARHETNPYRILFREELDDRLAERWATIQRRVRAILEDKHGEPGHTPDRRGSGEGKGSGT